MKSHLVEELSIAVVDDETEAEPIYREDLQYNVTVDGTPLVESSVQAGTVTQTKVKQEHDDADPSSTVTRTSVAREGDDRD